MPPSITPSAQVAQRPLVCSGHSRPVPFVAYSTPNSDGAFFMITSCLDGRAMLRVGNTGDWIGTFVGHKGSVWSAALSGDASLALTGSADYTATLWSATSGDALASFEHKHIVRAVDLTRDARRAATGGRKKVLRVLDVADDKLAESWQCADAHSDSIKRVLFSDESGESLFSAGGKTVSLWDVRQAGLAGPSLKLELSGAVNDVALCGDTLMVAHGESVAFVDAKTLAVTREHVYPFAVHSSTLHVDGKRFLAGGANFAAMVCDVESGDALEVHKGHHGPVHCVRYAPDNETYASSSEDGTIRLWQTTVKNYGLWVVNDDKPEPTAAPAPAEK